MKKITAAWLALLIALLIQVPAHAQVTIDVSKITCEQFWFRKVANPDKVGIWLSGFYNGKSGNTVIDPQKLESTTRDITEYCRANFNLTVMQATEAVMARK
jgi:acid stress chaperone HdeB